MLHLVINIGNQKALFIHVSLVQINARKKLWKVKYIQYTVVFEIVRDVSDTSLLVLAG